MDLQELKCEICKMSFGDQKIFETHKNGKKHQKNLKTIARNDKKLSRSVHVMGEF